MNMIDIALIVLIALALLFAVRSIVRSSRRGGACSGRCEGCSGCSACLGSDPDQSIQNGGPASSAGRRKK